MSESLGERVSELREHVQPGWDQSDTERSLVGLHGRIRRRRQAAYGVGALSALAALLLVLWPVLSARESPVSSAPTVARAPEGALQTHDGSIARRLSQHTELRVEYEREHEVSLALTRGKGRFEVTRNPQRRYRVRAGDVDVEVLGTAFEVERRGEKTHVHVDHGLVRVRWPNGQTLLKGGESGVFPPELEAALPAAQEPSDPVALEQNLEQPVHAREDWRALARAGRHREAFGSLGQRPVQDLSGLLLAADAARLSGHPREAVQHLERLVRRYPRSASARLAAFTLGRLALNELNEPRLAARSFARAYALDPRGPLAEDALAREAEAYHRAGQAGRASRAAARYIERFPDGARRSDMSSYLAH